MPGFASGCGRAGSHRGSNTRGAGPCKRGSVGRRQRRAMARVNGRRQGGLLRRPFKSPSVGWDAGETAQHRTVSADRPACAAPLSGCSPPPVEIDRDGATAAGGCAPAHRAATSTTAQHASDSSPPVLRTGPGAAVAWKGSEAACGLAVALASVFCAPSNRPHSTLG